MAEHTNRKRSSSFWISKAKYKDGRKQIRGIHEEDGTLERNSTAHCMCPLQQRGQKEGSDQIAHPIWFDVLQQDSAVSMFDVFS